MTRRGILAVLAALGVAAVGVASFFATTELLDWRNQAADEACFAAPEPDCLLDAAERIAGRIEEDFARAMALRTVARGRGGSATWRGCADCWSPRPNLHWPMRR